MAGLINEGIEEINRVPALREQIQGDIEAYGADKLPPDVVSDIRLARFINAFDGDLDMAAKAFRKMLEWRRTENVDELRNGIKVDSLEQKSFPHWEVVRSLEDHGPWYNSGKCHKGDLVHLEVIGNIDPTLQIETVNEERILQHQIGFFETRANVLDEMSKEQGRLVRTIQLRDLSKFGAHLLSHSKALGVLQRIMKAGSSNYPESTRTAIFINTPMSFYVVWQGVSVVLREKTRKKVKFLKNDYHRELVTLVQPRIIHRLEKLSTLKDHSFVEKGDEEDHLPLEIKAKHSIGAGVEGYYPIWLTRKGPRSKCTIKVVAPKEPTYVFVSCLESQLIETPGENVDPQAVQLPTDWPEEIDSGYLLLTFDNKESWMYSLNIEEIQVNFVGQD